MKWVKRLAVALVILVVLVVALGFFIGPIIRTAVNRAGPKLLGVPVSLGAADVSVWRGRVVLRDFVLGNPEGFKTAHAIRVGLLRVEVSLPSMFTRRILIRQIEVDAPEITYELGLSGSNIGKILDGLQSGAPAQPEKPAEPTPAGKEPRKVQIDDLRIENGRILLSAKIVGGHALPIPLPTVELKDIGKESGGTSVREAVTRILRAITEAVTGAVGGAASAAGAGIQAVGHGAQKVGSSLLGAATNAIGGIGNEFRKKDQ